APDRRQLLGDREGTEDVLTEARLALESIGDENDPEEASSAQTAVMRDAVLQMALGEKEEEMGRPASGRRERRRIRAEEKAPDRKRGDGEDFRFDQWTKLRSKESLKLVEPDIDIGVDECRG
ncbi:hypothetical protein FOZ63_023432, partial [Perkinsus olseni]